MALTLSLSAFSGLKTKNVNAEPATLDATNGRIDKLWDNGKYYVPLASGSGTKSVEVFRANDANGDYVYCIKAGTSFPTDGADLTDALQLYSSAQQVMGIITWILTKSTIPANPNTGEEFDAASKYIVRQLAIWHIIYLQRSLLDADGIYCTSDNTKLFKGYDINTLSASNAWVKAAKQVLDELPGDIDPYIPQPLTYLAQVTKDGTIQYDSSTKKYYADFTVSVYERLSGQAGGMFHFKNININGGTIYAYNGGSVDYSTAVDTNKTFSVGSTPLKFRIESPYSSMISVGGKKAFRVEVEANGTGSQLPTVVNYGLFKHSTNDTRQTFITAYYETKTRFESSNALWEATMGSYKVTKVVRHPDGSTTPEPSIRFRLYSTAYSSWDAAYGDRYDGTTDANGELTFTNIPFGTYYLVQVDVPSNTWAMNPNPAVITISGSSDYGTFVNEEKSNLLQIHKKVVSSADERAGTPFDQLPPEQGAKFQVYAKGYTWDNCPSYMKAELETDVNGFTSAVRLPSGTYNVHQTYAPDKSYECADFEVVLPDGPDPSGTSIDIPFEVKVTNKLFELNIQIRKIDETTGAVIPSANVEFQVIAADQTTVIAAEDGTTVFKTDDSGVCNITNLNLTAGNYYIKELTAPKGYIKSDTLLPFEAKKGEPLITVGGSDLKRIDFANKPVDIELVLKKNGEQLTGAVEVDAGYEDLKGHDFVYSEVALKGATYELYADSDVFDVEGNYRKFNGIEIKKGELLGTFTTDADGKIDISGLYLDVTTSAATYKLIEKSAPAGYTIDPTPIVFELTDNRADQTITVIVGDNTITDKKQSATFTFGKVAVDYEYDPATKTYVPVEKPLSDAVFGVYSTTDILGADGSVVLGANELIEVVKSDDSGKCVTKADYPLGYDYVIKEIKAPDGYMLNDGEYTISANPEAGNNTTKEYTFSLDEPIVNELSRACLAINKLADDTQLPMANVEFELIDPKSGDVIEKIVTDAEGKATTKTALPYGTTVILRETKTDDMYELAADMFIRINVLQKDLTKYGVQDQTVINYKKADISILKVTGDGKETVMDGVTFELWKKGTNGAVDELVATEVTDAKGELHFYVALGEYYLKETSVGKWAQFTTIPDPIDVSATEHGKIYNFKLSDEYTTTLVEKNDAKNGKKLGNCGISVRNAANITLTFVWNADLGGYVYCDPNTAGATQVLFTNNDANAAEYGMVKILGLEAGSYEIFEVQAPDGYRNDSTVIKLTIDNTGKPTEVLHLYDTLKTAERDTIIGYTVCGILGVSAVAFLALAAVELFGRRKRKHE
ncbi:MAG: Cys-Gln thioester bond-forming surface protein [Clostridiales bacterium]|nr:Cys-Gln thioester bond-forming surface protein [Clostridiales bacterium]